MKLHHLVCAIFIAVAAGAQDEGIKLKVYSGRSFYTDEKEAVMVCEPAAGLQPQSAWKITVRAPDQQILGKSSEIAPLTLVSCDIAGLSNGTHTLKVEIRNEKDAVVSVVDTVLIKRPPKPGLEWKLDRINRVLLKNGRPFFPFGLLMQGTEDDFKVAAGIGYNTLHTWGGGQKPEQARACLIIAEKYGLGVVLNLAGFCQGIEIDTTGMQFSDAQTAALKKILKNNGPKKVNAGLIYDATCKALPEARKIQLFQQYCDKNSPAFAEAIRLAADQPSLIGHNLFDEPIELSSIFGRSLYAQVHAQDGYHPAFVIYSSGIPKGDEYVDWTDILGADMYWTPGNTGVQGSVNKVAKYTCLLKKRADERRQVASVMPMAEYYSGVRKRAIMPKEQFCQTYLAVIHGAKSVIYFRGPFIEQITEDTHKALAKEMREIGPIAVTPDIPQAIAYVPGRLDPEKDEFPDVQVALRHNPAGGYVLLAANSRYYPVDITCRIALLGEKGKVKRLFGSETYPIINGAFSDRLECMDTRAYAFDGPPLSATPMAITVEMKSYPDKADPVYAAQAMPDSGRPGKKNIMRNPGFEEVSIPDWPDYYLLPAGPRLGRADDQANRGIDTKKPYEGKNCWWMRGAPIMIYGACSPKVKEPTEYVFSVYMRADRDGVKARFRGFGWLVPKETFGEKEFTLTTEWKRYWEKGTLPPGLPDWHSLAVVVQGGQAPATVWVDALQFEQGTEPTDYEP